MHICALCGNVTAAKILHSRGADVNKLNGNQETPLDMVRSGKALFLDGKIGLERRSLEKRFQEMERFLIQWASD
jgi:hypothetical protein